MIHKLPRFLRCRECPEIPGCETIIECHTGILARIVKFDAEAAFHPTEDFPYSQVPGYNIIIESIDSIHNRENLLLTIIDMATYLKTYIDAHPNKFKKWLV